jgi:hypothetical protein
LNVVFPIYNTGENKRLKDSIRSFIHFVKNRKNKVQKLGETGT